jgi:hypothetical protein
LSLFLSRHQPSVLVLQEPKHNHLTSIKRKGKVHIHTPKPLPKFTSYTPCYFTHPSQPTGIIIYIHTSCTFMALKHIPHCSPYRPANTRTIVGFVWVSSPLLPCPIIVGGAYIHDAMIETDISSLAEHTALASNPLPSAVSVSASSPVFLVGDFNAHHPSWDPKCRDSVSSQTMIKGKWINKHLIAPTAQALHPSLSKLTLANTQHPHQTA